jgi:hypothetical protein
VKHQVTFNPPSRIGLFGGILPLNLTSSTLEMPYFETTSFSKEALFWGAPVHSVQNIFMRQDQDLCEHQNENKRKKTRANTKTQIILKMPVSIAINNPTRRYMRTQN